METTKYFDLSDDSTEKLVERFNDDTKSKGWVAMRGHYIHAIFEEFEKRKINVEVVRKLENGYLCTNMNHKVKLVNNKLELL
jgi:hypothetical protein